MHRLFVALRPPPPIRASLCAMMQGVPGARWQDDEQLHLTLRYIGKVDRRVAEDLALALAQIRAPAVDARIAGVGQFDHKGRTDTLWADVTPHDALTALHHKVDHALVRLGLPPESRAYRPHITLARLSRTAGAGTATAAWLTAHADTTSVPFALTHLILYESHLDPDAARYEPVARWPLGGG